MEDPQPITALSEDSQKLLLEIYSGTLGKIGMKLHVYLDGIVNPSPQFTDVRSAARMNNVSEKEFRKWIKAGKFQLDEIIRTDGTRSELVRIGESTQGGALLLNLINSKLKHVRFESNGRQFLPSWESEDSDAGFWIRAAVLLHEVNRDRKRLKKCGYCHHLFWDSSPNRVKKICGSAECLKDRNKETVARFRKEKSKEEK